MKSTRGAKDVIRWGGKHPSFTISFICTMTMSLLLCAASATSMASRITFLLKTHIATTIACAVMMMAMLGAMGGK